MNTITIHNNQLPIVEYRGQRVVTLAMIDQVHERPEGTARRTFNEHKDRLIDGEDYIELDQPDVIRTLGFTRPQGGTPAKILLLTETGYSMVVKPFTDDLAWAVQRQLVNRYFRAAPKLAPALPGDYISALEHLLASKRSEQLAIKERDNAVATKSEIGSRREATAMATASAAVRQVQKLKDELGLGTRQAAILAVEKAVGRKFGVSGYVPLRRWCKERGITAPKVFHPTYGFVRCWPAGAWMDVYQIDLADLFGADGEQA